MTINNIKHIIAEIDGIRCTIVESGISIERAAFLRDLLLINNFEVKEIKEVSETSSNETKYTIGVTDLTLNPAFALYERRIKTKEGLVVSPAYWNQQSAECDSRYWIWKKNTAKI
jgi:hypothetical protein